MNLILSDKPLNVSVPQDGEIRYFDLSALKIANCMGCFGCWTKTPGHCVIRDDATKVYPAIAESDKLIYVSRLKYGGYDTVMKTMLERAIPVQQAFIRILNGETHHAQRSRTMKDAVIVAYGEYSEDEKELFRRLVERNSHNMNFASYDIVFVPENKIDDTIAKIIGKWEE